MIDYDMTNAEYRAAPGISATDVKTVMLRSLAHWQHGVRKESTAFDLGTAVHAMALEPHRDLVRCGPEDRRGNKWAEAKLAADLDGVTLLTASDYDKARAMADAVLANGFWREMMDRRPKIECSVFAKVEGVKIKARPDIWAIPIPGAGMLVDLKTTADASPRAFAQDVAAYGYHMQAAHYLRTLSAAGEWATSFTFVAVEKEPPYAVGVYEMTPEYLALGHKACDRAYDLISAAMLSHEYPTGWPEVTRLQPPAWMLDDDPLNDL